MPTDDYILLQWKLSHVSVFILSFNLTLIASYVSISAVHALQVELGELKGRLTEVISNCDSLCKRINSDGLESLRSSVTPFSATSTSNPCSVVKHINPPSEKAGVEN